MGAPSIGRISGAKLRLGIVGLGKMGMLHLRTWQRLSDVTITALVDADQGKARWAGEHELAFFRAGEEIIGLVDAVVIATPADQHVCCALPLLTAGIHCLVEKPIGINFDDSQRLVTMAERNRAVLAIGHSERFNPGLLHVRTAKASTFKRIEVFRMALLSIPRDPGADVVQDLMVHDLDWVISMMGQMPCEFKVKDAQWLGDSLAYVRCELQFAEDVQITLTASRMETERRREVIVHGADGRTQTISLELALNRREMDPLALQAHAFMAALRGKTSLIATGEEALLVMELGDRIRAHCEEAYAAAW